MSHERRGSHRWPVPTDRQKVVFKIDRTVIVGRLTDVSAGGFSVEVAAGVSFEAGTQVEMRTSDGTHIVQIAHVKREGDMICLGLERVRDTPIAEARVKKDRRLAHVGNPLFVLPVAAGILACTGTLLTAWKGPDWLIKSILDPAAQMFAEMSRPDSGPSRPTRYRREPAPNADSSGDETASSESTGENAEIEGSWTAWASHLNLSSEQLGELKARLNGKADEMVPSQLADLPDDALQQIYDMLTADQKERLTKLLAARKPRQS
jgi:hypothetical protein